MTPRDSWIGATTAILTLAGWSSVPLFLKHFSHTIDFWTSNGWRYGFSALFWAPVLAVAFQRRALPSGLWRAALVPSIINALGQTAFTWAHYRIDPGLLSFGLRSQLIFVAIGAYLLFPAERRIIRTPRYLIGLVILLGGTTGVLLGNSDALAAARLEGVALAVASGLLFAGYGLSVRKYMAGMNAVYSFAAICQFTAIALVIAMFALGERAGAAVLDLPADQIALLLLSAFVGIAIGHVFYYLSIARLGVAVTAGILQLQPFLVTLASSALFAERLSGGQWIGGIAAVCGAGIMLDVQRRVSRAVRAA